jgi:plastocyanin
MKMNKGLHSFRYFLPALLILLSLTVMVGCSGASEGSSNTGSSQSTGGNTIYIQAKAFSQPTLTIKVGTTVKWINQASETRSVASDSYIFTSYPLDKGNSYTYTFDKAGTYPYHCTRVASISETLYSGTIIVQP